MPVCPKCGRQINKLYYVIHVKTMMHVYMDGENIIRKICMESADAWFRCAKCGGKLFKNKEDAEKFLRGDLKIFGETASGCLR